MRRARIRRALPSSTRLLPGLIASLLMHGCSLLSPPRARPTVDVTGFWDGRSTGSCHARMGRCGTVEISLSMIQNESQVSGIYRCATGSVPCRNLIYNGRIAVGTISGQSVSLRIMFEDVSSCIFSGTFSDLGGRGSYICMQGGGIVDRGIWQVKRADSPAPWTG
jgi:hypothetical protein